MTQILVLEQLSGWDAEEEGGQFYRAEDVDPLLADGKKLREAATRLLRAIEANQRIAQQRIEDAGSGTAAIAAGRTEDMDAALDEFAVAQEALRSLLAE